MIKLSNILDIILTQKDNQIVFDFKKLFSFFGKEIYKIEIDDFYIKSINNNFILIFPSNSKIELYFSQEFYENNYTFILKNKSNLKIYNLAYIKNNIEINWTFYQKSNTKLSLISSQKFIKSNSNLAYNFFLEEKFSKLSFWQNNLLEDNSKINCKYQIEIKNKAKYCKADLKVKNLFSDNACQAFNQPILNIFNDTSEAKHSFSQTELDYKSKIYLKSKGFTLEKINKLYQNIFLKENFELIPKKSFLKEIENYFL